MTRRTEKKRVTAISIRLLNIVELDRVREIDVSESGSIVYKQVGRRVELAYEEWHRPPRSEETWNCYIELWKPILVDRGCAVGAFAGDLLVGIAVLRFRLTERMAQLAALFVSRDYRRFHIAQRLMDEVARRARQYGAAALYVSATPSASAIGFYTSQGFEATDQVNEELYELEPEDIHLVKAL
jgi:GNAT superfamily N-acetyltransferase